MRWSSPKSSTTDTESSSSLSVPCDCCVCLWCAGEVVGINSIGMTTSSTVQFSVPINQIKAVVTDLANGKVRNRPIPSSTRRRVWPAYHSLPPSRNARLTPTASCLCCLCTSIQAVVHPSIGVEMMPITPSLAQQLNTQVSYPTAVPLPSPPTSPPDARTLERPCWWLCR